MLSMMREMNKNIQRVATIMEREVGMTNIHIQKLELALVNSMIAKQEKLNRMDKVVVPVEVEWLFTTRKEPKSSDSKSSEPKTETKMGIDKRSAEKRKHEGQGLYNKPSFNKKPTK